MKVMAVALAGLFIGGSAFAQSFLIINNSGCIQWINIRNANGKWCVTKALAENADVTLANAKGTGISYIGAGPTAAIDDCCYSKRINASVNLEGDNWRIEINPSELKVINRNTYTEVLSGAGEFSRCVTPSGASGGILGGILGGGQPQEPLTTREQ